MYQDTLNILKAEGYTFPALRESDAMFAADRAPNWSDGDNCHRCRVQFSVIFRKVVKNPIVYYFYWIFTYCFFTSTIAGHVDKCFVVNARPVAAHCQNSALRRKCVFARIASTNIIRNI